MGAGDGLVARGGQLCAPRRGPLGAQLRRRHTSAARGGHAKQRGQDVRLGGRRGGPGNGRREGQWEGQRG